MSGLSLRLLGLGCALVLVHGCADGGGTSNSGFTSVNNPTQVSSATQDSVSDTGATGSATEPITTGAIADASSSGSAPDPTTTGVDGTTTTGPVDPSTTTGPVDPSTTTGPVDPSTTTGADDTTGVVMTTMTNDGTTTDEPPPPPKDAQPVNGLYESCKDNAPCDLNLTDGCFTITDENDVVIDGYCTILCNVVGDCGPKLNVPAVQECFAISADQKVCGLKCTGVKDCPTGMACTNLALPNNKTGMYCT